MEQKKFNNLSLWQFENLSLQPSIKHFVTDRNSSRGGEFTLSLSSSPDRQFVLNNRAELAKAMGITPDKIFFPSQVHLTHIVKVNKETSKEELMEKDALISNERGICICVMSADCVPILLYDKKNNAVGAVHSGWKGTAARILEKTLIKMRDTFGTQGEHVVAGIGPSVCQESYEVGEEVIEKMSTAFGSTANLMTMKPNNKAQLDLWKANKIQLLQFGVPESSIEISNLCTVKNNSHFFSARKGDSGRFAAGIMIA